MAVTKEQVISAINAMQSTATANDVINLLLEYLSFNGHAEIAQTIITRLDTNSIKAASTTPAIVTTQIGNQHSNVQNIDDKSKRR